MYKEIFKKQIYNMLYDCSEKNWLEADELNFMHDFMGIQMNCKRYPFPETDFGKFIPRFSGKQ